MSTHAGRLPSPDDVPGDLAHGVVVVEDWRDHPSLLQACDRWLRASGVRAVTVLAPPVVGAVEWLTGDTAAQQSEAVRRLQSAVAGLQTLDVDVVPGHADDDPVASVAAVEAAGTIRHVLFIRGEDRSSAWRQSDVAGRLEAELGVTVEVLDPEVDIEAPGAFVDDRASELPEPNEPA